jgi:hypothetical protein
VAEGVVVGVRPWLPGSLGRWDWLAAPVRAERLAALRVGVGLVLLLDILATYLPFLHDYYGPGSLADPDVFASRFEWPHWHWSVLRWLPDTWGPPVALAAWALAALALAVGWHPRAAAAVAWALSLSFFNSNYYLHNSGDRLRHTLLFILMLAPSGAVWAVSGQRSPRKASGRGETEPVYVYPWALRLLFVQLVLIYFMNGVYKLFGPEWRDGTVMHYVLNDVGWARWSLPLPLWLTRAAGWFVLAWELSFPLMVLRPVTRWLALGVGAAFHVFSGLNLELGLFPLYALCFYLPLLPWERLSSRGACSRPECATQ